MKSNKIIERNPSATAAGAEGDVVRDHDSLSEGELESIVGGVSSYPTTYAKRVKNQGGAGAAWA